MAISTGHPDVANLLIECRCDPMAVDKKGRNAWCFADDDKACLALCDEHKVPDTRSKRHNQSGHAAEGSQPQSLPPSREFRLRIFIIIVSRSIF